MSLSFWQKILIGLFAFYGAILAFVIEVWPSGLSLFIIALLVAATFTASLHKGLLFTVSHLLPAALVFLVTMVFMIVVIVNLQQFF